MLNFSFAPNMILETEMLFQLIRSPLR